MAISEEARKGEESRHGHMPGDKRGMDKPSTGRKGRKKGRKMKRAGRY